MTISELINKHKVNFLLETTSKNSSHLLPKWNIPTSLWFPVTVRPKNITYCHVMYSIIQSKDMKDFIFDTHKYTLCIFWHVIMVSIIQAQLYLILINSYFQRYIFYGISFLLDFNIHHHKLSPIKIRSLHQNGSPYTCKEMVWKKETNEYQIW